MRIGQKVEVLIDLPSVPRGSIGYVVEDYGTGIMVAWDLPGMPYPKDLTFEQVGAMWATQPNCPIRDGFNKETELDLIREV